MNNISFYGNTDLGRNRTNNEDAFIAQNIWDNNHVLAVAIDGVGGYEGGEIAAALAQKNIVEYLELYPNGECIDLLKQAVVYANNIIFQERKNQPQYGSMSCVLTAILIDVDNRQINMAHVGDTRLYQYANGELVKLSHDHSLVGYREEIGELTELEAMRHPQRNVIGRDVGSTFLETSGNDYVEIKTFPLIPNSYLLLCSDGLCDMITSAQMKDILVEEKTVKDKVNLLIQAANDAGGKDNVTVVLVHADIPEIITEPQPADEIVHEDEKTKEQNDEILSKTKRHKVPVLLICIICVLFSFIGGLILGSYKADGILPSIIHKDETTKTDLLINKDSIIIELRKDTMELRKVIIQQDELIDILQNAIGVLEE